MLRGLRWVAFATFVVAAMSALAGEFRVHQYGGDGINVADSIEDVVTDAFTNTFDAKHYTIVVYYNHVRMGDDNICDAFAGVSRWHDSDKVALVPAWRFISTHIFRDTGPLNVTQVRECDTAAIRDAVKDLMSVSPREIMVKLKDSL